MEILKVVVWSIWGVVGLVTIGIQLHGIHYYRALWKNWDKEEAE